MNHAEFQERWEMEAAKESEHYRALSPAELAQRMQRGEFGNYYTLWRAVAARCHLGDVADTMLEILHSDADYLIRYHCAEALIALSGGAAEGFQAVQLSARETHDVARRLTHFEAHLKKRKP